MDFGAARGSRVASKGYLFKGAAWRKRFLVLQVCLVSGNPDYNFFNMRGAGV